jgi:molybdopterin molybdotransferase
MAASHHNLQRIERLTPLREVLSRITASLSPIAPRDIAIADALGHIAAEAVTLTDPLPAAAIALIDGYAVRSDATADASAYAPMPLADAQAIDAGQRLPAGADAVLSVESIMTDAAGLQALAPAMPGEGVLAPGVDVRPGEAIQLAGMRVRLVDVAVLAAAGLRSIAVRAPRVRVVAAREDAILRQIVALLERLVGLYGGDLLPAVGNIELASALAQRDAQLTIVVGGSGSGRDDRSVQTLARAGRVDVHGIAIGPGHTSALGMVDGMSVLVVPGRIDAALAAWLLVGVPMMRRLTGAVEDRPRMVLTLERKITSAIGLLEFVPVRVHQEKALPLASVYLPLHALSQANAYIVVPAESEGYPEGAIVTARLIP